MRAWPINSTRIVCRVLDRTAAPTAAGSAYGTSLAAWELFGPAAVGVDPVGTVARLREELGGRRLS